jgi:fructosamine-3-kinase
MRSPTQRVLSPEHVSDLVSGATGVAVTAAAPLAGGGFAAVWRVSLADGRDVVLKMGPPPEAALLEYEAGLIAAEATYLRLVAGAAPVPGVLHAENDWIITTFLPGTPLTAVTGDQSAVRHDLGAAVARVHRHTGASFGYSGDRPSAGNWPDAFGAMVASLLRDAVRFRVALPTAAVNAVLERGLDDLAQVQVPVLVHFDLWDGNVLSTVDGSGTPRLSGLVDGERYLYADALFDFVSPLLRGRMEDEPDHPFRQGYASLHPVVLDLPARRRLAMYRVYFYLLMLVEMPSRGMTGADHEPRRRWLIELLDRQLADLT